MSETPPFSLLVKQWLAAHAAFMADLSALSPERREVPGVCGVWNARQVVAHLAGWHYEAVRRFAEFAAGDTRDRVYDDDAYNAVQVAARAAMTWDQTTADLQDAITILAEQAAEIDDRHALRDLRYTAWITGLAGDIENHHAELVAWLGVSPAP